MGRLDSPPYFCTLCFLIIIGPLASSRMTVGSVALREAAENATFTFPEAACARLDQRPTRRCGRDGDCESVPEQFGQRVRKIITHRHFLELSLRRTGRRSS